jgi:hypothetical protein
LRQNGDDGRIARPIGDMPCGGLPNGRQLIRLFERLKPTRTFNISNAGGRDLLMFIERMNHAYNVERHRYITRIEDNQDLRVKYMMNEIEEDKFKRLLQQREKARLKNREYEQVIEMAYTVSCDVYRGILDGKTHTDVLERVHELENLMKYADECMATIATKYNVVKCGAFAFSF